MIVANIGNLPAPWGDMPSLHVVAALEEDMTVVIHPALLPMLLWVCPCLSEHGLYPQKA